MKILVTGARGQLGQALMEQRRDGVEMIGLGREQADITDERAVREAISGHRPDIVVHCASYTNVDRAQDEAQRCMDVNVGGVRNVAAACRDIDAGMIYLSSDYVFSGEKHDPYETDDATDPINVYGESKCRGEEAVLATLDKACILRVSWMFGGESSFVQSILRLAKQRDTIQVVGNQYGSPSYAPDLAEFIVDMATRPQQGIFHLTNDGFCTWADFAYEILRMAQVDCRILHVSDTEFVRAARRPKNSMLSKTCLDERGFARLPHWKTALQKHISNLQSVNI